jgi:hypothetical protein
MDAMRIIEGASSSPEWDCPESDFAPRFQVLHPDHPDRVGLQRFIAERYAANYGARIGHYAELLVGLRDVEGAWAAGLGYTLAGRDRLFVEQYLDQPVEDAISSKLDVLVGRDQIVEVGNLAASGAGAARRLIVHMTGLLHELGRTWVVFTSTRALLNSFTRLKIATVAVARADPSRLPDGGESWGSYYETDPQVVTANIPLGFIHLRFTQHTLRTQPGARSIFHPEESV